MFFFNFILGAALEKKSVRELAAGLNRLGKLNFIYFVLILVELNVLKLKFIDFYSRFG